MTPIEPVEPIDRLRKMTAADDDPPLDDGDLNALLAQFARVDVYGATPTDTDWTATYNFNAAAAEGWRWKAGRVIVTSSSRSLEGDRDPDGWKYLNCLRQAELYAAKVNGSVRVGGRPAPRNWAARMFYGR